MTYGFYFNGQRCTGCKTCVMACKDKNDLAENINFRNVLEYGGGTWEKGADGCWGTNTFAYNVSIACNHCDMPMCMAQCPQGAIEKDADTGEVRSDPEKCIGCGTCATTCPYGAPKVDMEQMKSVKCNMCADRVEAGQKPICVEACPLRALDFGDIDELRATYGDVADLAPLPDSSETSPNLVITAPAQAAAAPAGELLNEREIL